ncbi:TetR/AcrR family transcriptional regulator [Nocardia sp. NPDC052566]|uniref:TetR/AcrR family transcriptional regulator n=1 Tax=Nocardia sp. NPDC052566 TaxID=3364330 RepID=UPI0037C74F5F
MADRPGGGKHRTRRYDPQRSMRIAEAAVRVIGERGVEGLTHRAVAAEGDVPIAGTTYHYRSKEDLLLAALEISVAEYEAIMAAIPVDHPDLVVADVIEMTADALLDCFTAQRARTTVQLELYVAAIRRPALRPVADRFTAATRGLYARYTDPETAELLADLAQGLTLRGMASMNPPTREQIRALLTRCLP